MPEVLAKVGFLRSGINAPFLQSPSSRVRGGGAYGGMASGNKQHLVHMPHTQPSDGMSVVSRRRNLRSVGKIPTRFRCLSLNFLPVGTVQVAMSSYFPLA